MEIAVKNVTVDTLIPYVNNPKEHPPAQIDKIASSIKNYGFTVPIVIDGQNEIIMGHGRVTAAKKLGMSEVPCIIRDDLTESQVKALRIADNKVSESEWDIELLLVEIEDIEEFTGFDVDKIEDLLLKRQVDFDSADYAELMAPAVDRPDQVAEDQRITVMLKGGPDILTTDRLKELRRLWAPLGVEVLIMGDKR